MAPWLSPSTSMGRRTVSTSTGYAAPVGAARCYRPYWYEVWLRHGALWRLHRACQRRSNALMRHAYRKHRHFGSHDHRGDREHQSVRGFRRRGLTAKSRNAATASPGRSCRLRRSFRRMLNRLIPILTTPCPATSAAVEPMCGFAKRSSRLRKRRLGNQRCLQTISRLPGTFPDPLSASSRRNLSAGEQQQQAGVCCLAVDMPFSMREAEAAVAGDFTPNAFISIGATVSRPDHALCRDGPRHLHVHPDADC